MKVLILFLIPLCSMAEWIVPPLKTEGGYPVPQPDVVPVLPRAHGAHPGYGIEWWYWVGHLQSEDGSEQFGFQSTVFRLEGAAGGSRQSFKPVFGKQQLFMAHAALTSITDGTYVHHERIYREGWQARASSERLDLQVGGIQARMEAGSETMTKRVKMKDGAELVLTLVPTKPLVSFGERGLSRKGSTPSAVSWYWTYPRLELKGELIRDGVATPVKGIGWLDHEISSSQLGEDLEGWDWTAIQLDDGTEVKAYRLRREDGKADPWSAVYWIDEKGKARGVYAKDFTWKGEAEWTSEQTGHSYPTTVQIEATYPVSGETHFYRLVPLMAEQEFVGNRGDNPYWEGACAVFDRDGNRIGKAYLELAGYGGSMGGMLTK